jgi:hypothetical protein
VAVYRALLSGVDTEGLILDEGRAATGYERTVTATLSLAFARLSPAVDQLPEDLAAAAAGCWARSIQTPRSAPGTCTLPCGTCKTWSAPDIYSSSICPG